jgi:hypothetical protein
MHLLIGFLPGSLLVHKCVDAHAIALMNVVSLYDVDGDIQIVGICFVFVKFATHCVCESMASLASLLCPSCGFASSPFTSRLCLPLIQLQTWK